MARRHAPSSTLARRLQIRSDAIVVQLASVRIEPASLPEGTTVVGSKKYDLGSRRYVDAGKVEIEVAAPGYISRTRTAELGRGEERLLSVNLSSEPVAAPPAASPPVAPPPPAEPAAPTPRPT